MRGRRTFDEEDMSQVIHLPYTFFCPICGKEQQHLLFCVLCGAVFPAECEEHRGRRLPSDYWEKGISLESIRQGKWLGLPKQMEAFEHPRLGFLNQHGHPKWSGG